jgi:hypothetical protein
VNIICLDRELQNHGEDSVKRRQKGDFGEEIASKGGGRGCIKCFNLIATCMYGLMKGNPV